MTHRSVPKCSLILFLAVMIIMAFFYEKIYTLESYLSKLRSQATAEESMLTKQAQNIQQQKIDYGVATQIPVADLRQPIINLGVLDYDIPLRNEFLRLVELKVEDTDPHLIELTRQLVDPPSKHMTKFARAPVKTPQVEAIDQLLNMKSGFFFECGALDGERSSNSIWLEKFKNWTGLLVEMDPYYYTQIRGKNRHSFSINACLSTTRHPEMMYFKESEGGQGQLVGVNETVPLKYANKIRRTPCIPITTMLLALKQRRIDFLSLDVEGFELPILRTFRWDLINVKSIAVEYSHSHKKELKAYIESQGYTLISDIHFVNHHDTLYVDDFIFSKR